jgi:hypothetical protein
VAGAAAGLAAGSPTDRAVAALMAPPA